MDHLRHLNLQLFKPAPALRSYVHHYWRIECDSDPTFSSLEYLASDGSAGITLNLADALILDGIKSPQRCLIHGPRLSTSTLKLGARNLALGIRFWPGCAFPFLKEPVHVYLEQLEPSNAFSLRAAPQLLIEQLAETSSVEQQVELLNQWLLTQLGIDESEVPAVVSFALQTLTQIPQIPITDLASKFGISTRQLERLFRHWVGLSPKRFAQIMRVRGLREQLKKHSPSVSLAGLASDAGYVDQAHFNREFKQVSGLTPGQYLKLKHTAVTS